jgi:hypothetical protein
MAVDCLESIVIESSLTWLQIKVEKASKQLHNYIEGYLLHTEVVLLLNILYSILFLNY